MPVDCDLLRPDAVRLRLTAVDAADAIVQCGRVLVETGAVDEPYVEAMRERERVVSTAIGCGVALPHAVGPARHHVRRAAFAVMQFPDGVHWDGGLVSVCAAIASREDDPVELISLLTRLLLDEQQADVLRTATDRNEVLALLRSGWAELIDPDDSAPAPVSSAQPTARRPGSMWARLADPAVPGPSVPTSS